VEVPDELWAAVQARIEKVRAETLALRVVARDAGADRAGVVAGTVGTGTVVRVAVVAAAR